jgi:hypothetical protein
MPGCEVRCGVLHACWLAFVSRETGQPEDEASQRDRSALRR